MCLDGEPLRDEPTHERATTVARPEVVPYAPRHAENATALPGPDEAMTARVFPFAGLLTAYDATPADVVRVAELARVIANAGAAPVVVALAPEIEAPPLVRVVRTRARGSPIASVRLGMAQLTNTMARAVLLVPLRAERTSLVALLSLVDAAKRDEQAIVAGSAGSLDESALVVPRDAWLDLVTLGEGGMDAVAARRKLIRVATERVP